MTESPKISSSESEDKIFVLMIRDIDQNDDTWKRLNLEVARSVASKIARKKYLIYHLELVDQKESIHLPELKDNEKMVRYIFQVSEGVL